MVNFTNSIRWIGGKRKRPTRGITIPRWVFEEMNFEEGERVKITMEKR